MIGNTEFEAALYANPFRRWTTHELLSYATSQPLLYEPGTNWNYAHTNYVLLGLALEKATGEDMSKLLSDKVLRPLGLTNTVNSMTAEIPSPVLHAFSSERREALEIPGGTPFYEETTYWDPSWTITHGAIQTPTSTTSKPPRWVSARAAADARLAQEDGVHRPSRQDPGAARLRHLRARTTATPTGSGIVISGDWLLQNPMFAGYAARRGLPAVAEDRDRRRRHLFARGVRRPGQLPQRGRRRCSARSAPNWPPTTPRPCRAGQ